MNEWSRPPPTGHGHQQPSAPAPQPVAAPPVYVQPQTNTLAVVSLIFGILWLFWIGSLIAVITGHMATGQIDRSAGREGGRGIAVAGLVLGWIGIGPVLFFFGLAIIGGISGA